MLMTTAEHGVHGGQWAAWAALETDAGCWQAAARVPGVCGRGILLRKTH